MIRHTLEDFNYDSIDYINYLKRIKVFNLNHKNRRRWRLYLNTIVLAKYNENHLNEKKLVLRK